MPMRGSYYTPFRCAACGADQQVYTGDLDDITAVEVDAVECFKCGKVEVVCDAAWVEVKGGPDNLNTVKGEACGRP